MKTTIYFFSGTGNSLAVAKDIANKLGDCTLIPVAKYLDMESVTINSEKVGFVFPLYYQSIPKLVTDFIRKANFSNTNYLFTVITKGAPNAGSAVKEMVDLLNDKGLNLNLGSYILMPQNFVTGFKIPVEKVQEKLFDKAKIKIDDICNLVKLKKNKFDAEPLAFLKAIKKTSLYQKNIIIHDEQFYTDANCNGCGICEKVCPVNNIKLSDNIPEWLGNCENCLACMHFCTKESIQYNTNTVKFDRYHHPDVSVKEIMNQKNNY